MSANALVDLRSDTVTRPTARMRAAIAEAEVGDDVYGEDPTVNRLEAEAARRLGLEAAVLATSGTQANLLALLSHCQRGDEYLVGDDAHTYRYEGGGGAALGGIQPQPIPMERDGTLDLGRVEAAIKPADVHFARTRLLCLENTHHGRVLPLAYLAEARALARRHGLAVHLDGARVFNAAVELGVDVAEITAGFDSVSFCLSKGLGAPAGSLLCGSRATVERARRWRKVLGGGMRQAGVLAAAGLVALAEHVDRLAEDHARARALADGLARRTPLAPAAATNMVFVPVGAAEHSRFLAHLRERGVLAGGRDPVRMVTHLDVDDAGIERAIEAAAGFFGGGNGR